MSIRILLGIGVVLTMTSAEPGQDTTFKRPADNATGTDRRGQNHIT